MSPISYLFVDCGYFFPLPRRVIAEEIFYPGLDWLMVGYYFLITANMDKHFADNKDEVDIAMEVGISIRDKGWIWFAIVGTYFKIQHFHCFRLSQFSLSGMIWQFGGGIYVSLPVFRKVPCLAIPGGRQDYIWGQYRIKFCTAKC